MKKLVLKVAQVKAPAAKVEPACRGGVVLPSVKGDDQKGKGKKSGHGSGHCHHQGNCGGGCCRGRLVDMLGRGKDKFDIPSVDSVVRAAIAQVPEGESSIEDLLVHLGGKKGGQKGCLAQGEEEEADAGRHRGLLVPPRKPIHPAALTDRQNPKGNALRLAAEAIRLVFDEHRFDAVISECFNPPGTGAINWARNHMGPEYQGAIESLGAHFTQLEGVYREALPRVIRALHEQYPEAHEDELKVAAVQVLSSQEKLATIIYVLSHYTEGFGQLRDGLFEPLQAVVYTVQQALNLFLSGDIQASVDKANEALVKTTNLKVGNRFLARAGDGGPATMPGANGPIGLHLILVPFDELSIIMMMMALYLHEFRHDVFADVRGLAREESNAVLRAISKAKSQGLFKLSAETVKVGETEIPLTDLISKVYLDNLGEIDADLVGGIGMCGWAFAVNLLIVFSALNSRQEGAIRNKHLLRADSIYEVDRKGELGFEPHPPDYLRAYINAEALELMGFKAQADEIRSLADYAVGAEKPEFITWEDADDKLPPISIAVSDLLQVAPVVVKAILQSPLKALKGKTNHQVASWNAKHQEKADALAKLLVEGSTQLPDDLGDIHVTHLAAAPSLAYWQLVCDGVVDPAQALTATNLNALFMLELVKARQAAKGQNG